MRVCIAGKNSIAVHGLISCVDVLGSDSVLACPNRSDSGMSNWQPSLIRYANEFGVKLISVEEAAEIDDLVFISLEFDRIIKPQQFKSNRLFNMHFSKLPAYKGVYTSAWPILNGDSHSGVTLHKIDQGIDTGEIIDQICFALDDKETARSLYFKCMEAALNLLDKNLKDIFSDNLSSRFQTPCGSTYYSKSSINYAKLSIDLCQTACVIGRQIRAYSFREFQVPIIGGVAVGDYCISDQRSKAAPGSIKSVSDREFILATIDYDLIFQRDMVDDLFYAIDNANVEDTKLLLKFGCDPNVTNRKGWTPLMIAAFKGDIDMCKILIRSGSETNACNQNGTTPLMYAKEFCHAVGNFSICELLIAHGADPNFKDRFGRSAFDYALINNQLAAIDFFGKFQ